MSGYKETKASGKLIKRGAAYVTIQIIRDTFWYYSDPPCDILLFKCLFLRLICLTMWNEQVRKYLIKRNLAFKQDCYFQKPL